MVVSGRWEMLTMVMATVFALVAGGLRIVTRPMERMMARTIRTICVMCMRNFQLSSKERIEDISCILVFGWPVVLSFGRREV
jgi:uncharacterized membrane protein